MTFCYDIYQKKLRENGEEIRFWEDHIKALLNVKFKTYSDKIKVPVLVPIGTRILFRGELKRTNEVITSLGMGYFAKCSTEQAEILRRHRLKDARSKLDSVLKEKEYLEKQLKFRYKTCFDETSEISEYQTEKEVRLWREKHKQNLKFYHENKNKKEGLHKDEKSDEELWNRLEELELQEELQNELAEDTENIEDERNSFTNSLTGEDYIEHCDNSKYDDTEETHNQMDTARIESLESHNSDDNVKEKEDSDAIQNSPENTNRLDILQYVLDKQKKLAERISEIKNQQRNVTKTESELLSRLDELEQLEEVEDEMDRLDDILYEPEVEVEEEENKNDIKRSVSFADQDESETLELTFNHSDVPAIEGSYDPKTGLLKPSDIYGAFSHLFLETKSILRNTEYTSETNKPSNVGEDKKTNFQFKKGNATNILIVIDDVKEKKSSEQEIIDSRHKRPTSIFKKRRQHKH